ncbi:MAG TPA: hypothetical protein VFG34_07190 [Sphingopyxis sp.]|nr:hypothetical protein [Sphingopyxis sp.]
MNLKNTICFVFIGGTHQIYHLAPVAAALSKRDDGLSISCMCADAEDEAALRGIAYQMQADRMQIIRMPLPWLARLAMRITGRKSVGKGPLLAALRWQARHARAIIVPERTSAVLRKMGWRRPLFHFRHGAGDRAPASEARLNAFDLIVVPGEKDIERAVGRGIDPSRLRIGGYVKLDYLRLAPPSGEPLFDNDRPIVVYNPHFDASLSSLGMAEKILKLFRQQDRYNLIFAPHIRGVEDMSAEEQDRLASLAMPGRIIIDLGSANLFNMRYTQAADIYLGDMSSQLYEFLARPRPVAFINAHSVPWQNDPRYAGWHLGKVANHIDDIIGAIDHAVADQQNMAAAQVDAVSFAFGDYEGAITRSADIVMEALLHGD